MKHIDCVNKNILNYYGISNANDAIVIQNVDEYVENFLKRYVLDRVKSNNTRYKKEFVFRGISRGDQKYSKITRQYYMNVPKLPTWGKEAYSKKINQELLYIRKFEQNTSFILPEPRNSLDIVAAAQHYTIKTRLIDWSTSPLVATLFSLHEPPTKLEIKGRGEKYYLVMAVDKNKHMVLQNLPVSDNANNSGENHYVTYGKMLNRLSKIYHDKDRTQVEEYFREMLEDTHTLFMLEKSGVKINSSYINNTVKKFSDKFISDKICFLETNFANSRIVNQRGIFQLAVNPIRGYIDNCMKYIDMVFISEEARRDIIKYCEALGVHYYALMPDSQSIASEINRKVEEGIRK